MPSGVGDTYWCLTKLRSFRERNRLRHVTLCVKESTFERASAWGEMVDFVDAVEVRAFNPNVALGLGFGNAQGRYGIDYVLWPNAVLDRGERIERWLPNYATDLAFPVKTAPGVEGAVVLYASSIRMHRSCFPQMERDYWPRVARHVFDRFGVPPVVIGAGFDRDYSSRLAWLSPVDDQVGNTTLPEVAGILQRARLVLGVISGMTILANHFRVPTVALCPDKYHRSFPRTWIARGTPYATVWARDLPSPQALVEKGAALC